MLGELLVHARRTPFWYQNNSVTYKLLKLCLMKGTLEDMCVLCLPINVSSRYGRQSIEETETSELIGIPDINYCPVQKHGWRNYKGIIRKVVDKKLGLTRLKLRASCYYTWRNWVPWFSESKLTLELKSEVPIILLAEYQVTLNSYSDWWPKNT